MEIKLQQYFHVWDKIGEALWDCGEVCIIRELWKADFTNFHNTQFQMINYFLMILLFSDKRKGRGKGWKKQASKQKKENSWGKETLFSSYIGVLS